MIKQSLMSLLLLGACSTAQAITVHNADFINDADRTNFNGFENIPNDGTYYTGGSGPYTEDGIQVQQINGDSGNDIWVTCTSCGLEGNFGWYPNGGDFGYTQITRSGGIDFEDVGMLIGSGWIGGAGEVFWELLDNGISVMTGSFTPSAGPNPDYIGFSGVVSTLSCLRILRHLIST